MGTLDGFTSLVAGNLGFVAKSCDFWGNGFASCISGTGSSLGAATGFGTTISAGFILKLGSCAVLIHSGQLGSCAVPTQRDFI